MFEHVTGYDWQDITVSEFGGKRYYQTPDGKKYPSVTTVLGADPKKKQSLMEWRNRVGAAEANRITARATGQGTQMHAMCEAYLKNEDDFSKPPLLEGLNDHQKAGVDLFFKIKAKMDKHMNRIHALEAPLWSHMLKVAGRVDCAGEWDGTLSIIDFKTSMKPKKKEWIENYFMQASAYACMFREITGVPVPQVVILMAVCEGRKSPQVFVEKSSRWINKLCDAVEYYEKHHA